MCFLGGLRHKCTAFEYFLVFFFFLSVRLVSERFPRESVLIEVGLL